MFSLLFQRPHDGLHPHIMRFIYISGKRKVKDCGKFRVAE